ncbi:choice-of-anchor G family protein [Promicromonospora sp. CA-289599]|uniref:choice-of-anchor G family protein n=1 Tax=Promicromonospora sp. CA-289599 TaxID=3240014 RepID=UPI003D91DCB1
MRRGLAAVAASALLITAVGAPAVAVDNYPDEPSEAAASVLASELMQQELLGAATSDAGSLSNPGPNSENLNVDLLGSQVLALGDIQLPVDQFLDFGQIGALASTSEASGPMDARAVSGLLGADGGVTLDGAEDSFGTASIDVLSLARLVGVDGITDAVVDELTIELGALGAEVIAEDGVILDPDGGVTGPGQYRLGDGTLRLRSPIVAGAADTIYDIGGAIDTQIETLVNETLDISALTALLAAVPGIPEPTVTVDSDMQETLFQSVVGEPITSANQLVTLDLSTGELQVHLEHLVEGNDPWGGGDDVGMNGLAPNYEVIDDQTYPQIAEGVHEIMQEATRILIGAIEDSLNAVTIDIAFFDQSALGTLDVSWSVPLADAVNGNFPQVVNNSTGVQAVTGTLLATTINGLGNAAAPIFGAVYDLIISDAGDQIFELLINDIKSGITGTIGAALSPVFDIVVQFVSLQINHQETATCTTADGTELLGQLEVSALSLGLVQSVDAGRIGLGNAGVRIDACDLAAIAPTLAVDPGEVAPGGTTTVTGEGYTPNSTATVQLTDADGNPVGDPIVVDTDENGGFTTPLVVPEDAEPGDYTVVGTDDTTDTPAEAPLVVTPPSEITPELSVDPAEVAPGDCTEVSGSGYTPSSTVTVQLTDADGNPVGEPVVVDTDENGDFTTELCVPEDAEPGDYTVVGTDDTTGTPAEAPLVVTEAPAIDPSITVDPAEVAPGGTTTVTGEGYTPNSTATVQLTDADGNPVGDPIVVDTDENGGFTTPLVVPEDAEPGDYTVVGTDDTTDTPAEAPLTVITGAEQCASAPELTVTPSSVPAGETVTVVGTGFPAGVDVLVQLTDAEGNPVGDPVTVTPDENCGFTTDYTVPEGTEPGDYEVVAEPEDGSEGAEAPLTVEPADIAPTLVVDPTEVEPGACTEVTGEGYTPSSTVTVQLTDADGNPVGDPIVVDTDENGAFTADLCVPEDAEPGDYTVVGTDDTTGTPAEAPLTITEPAAITPTLAVDPSEVAPGGTTTVTGEGYTPDSTVTVQLTDADGNPVGDPIVVDTDENGGFTTPLVVPEDADLGDYTVVGTDDTTGTPAEAPLTVISGAEQCASDPALTVVPDSVPAGETVTVTGTGFPAGVDVTVQLTDAEGNPVGDPVTVTPDEDCAFTTEYTVPEGTEPGDYEVVAEPEDGSEGAEAPLTVEPADIAPSLTVDPSEVAPGGTTTVTGEGYTPDSTVTVQLTDADGNPVGDPIVVDTDENGGFTTPLVVPEDAEPGDFTVVGTDDTTGTPAEAPLTVITAAEQCESAPELTVTPSSVPAGETVTVVGTGFPAGVDVTIQLTDAEGNPVGDPVTVTPDEACSFTTEYTVPEGTEPGDYEVVAEPEDGSEGAEAPLTVEPADIAPSLTVDPAEVAPGGTTTVTGEGYTPDSTVTVQLTDADGNPVGDPITVDTDENGGFTTPLTVPEDVDLGDYTVVGTDDTTGTPAEAPLTVISGAEQCESAPELTVAPSSAPAGETVTVVGTGFPAGVDVTIQLTDAEGNPVGDPVTVTPDENCGFTTDYTIPEGTEPGDYEVVAEPEDGSEGAEAPLTVEPGSDPGEECTDPTLVADPTSVEPGGEVTVTGTGFPAGVEVSVTLTDASGDPVGDPVTVTPDESCGFTVTIQIPDDADPGVHVIVAEPEDGSDGAEVPITVTGPDSRTLTAWFEKDSVKPGASQTLYAAGFEPGEMVVGVIRATSIRLQAAAADETGKVEWTFIVPPGQKAGSYIGTATSQTIGDSAAASFKVALTSTGGGNGNGNGDGNGSGNGNGSGSGSGSGGLATTGADVATLVTISMLLLGAGAVLIRRRRELAMAAATAMGKMSDKQ